MYTYICECVGERVTVVLTFSSLLLVYVCACACERVARRGVGACERSEAW